MCICINCDFYKNCWINKGLNKLPKDKKTLILNFSSNLSFPINQPSNIDLKIFMNIFKYRLIYEFDVIECEGFCESPGSWLN